MTTRNKIRRVIDLTPIIKQEQLKLKQQNFKQEEKKEPLQPIPLRPIHVKTLKPIDNIDNCSCGSNLFIGNETAYYCVRCPGFSRIQSSRSLPTVPSRPLYKQEFDYRPPQSEIERDKEECGFFPYQQKDGNDGLYTITKRSGSRSNPVTPAVAAYHKEQVSKSHLDAQLERLECQFKKWIGLLECGATCTAPFQCEWFNLMRSYLMKINMDHIRDRLIGALFRCLPESDTSSLLLLRTDADHDTSSEFITEKLQRAETRLYEAKNTTPPPPSSPSAGFRLVSLLHRRSVDPMIRHHKLIKRLEKELEVCQQVVARPDLFAVIVAVSGMTKAKVFEEITRHLLIKGTMIRANKMKDERKEKKEQLKQLKQQLEEQTTDTSTIITTADLQQYQHAYEEYNQTGCGGITRLVEEEEERRQLKRQHDLKLKALNDQQYQVSLSEMERVKKESEACRAHYTDEALDELKKLRDGQLSIFGKFDWMEEQRQGCMELKRKIDLLMEELKENSHTAPRIHLSDTEMRGFDAELAELNTLGVEWTDRCYRLLYESPPAHANVTEAVIRDVKEGLTPQLIKEGDATINVALWGVFAVSRKVGTTPIGTEILQLKRKRGETQQPKLVINNKITFTRERALELKREIKRLDTLMGLRGPAHIPAPTPVPVHVPDTTIVTSPSPRPRDTSSPPPPSPPVPSSSSSSSCPPLSIPDLFFSSLSRSDFDAAVVRFFCLLEKKKIKDTRQKVYVATLNDIRKQQVWNECETMKSKLLSRYHDPTFSAVQRTAIEKILRVPKDLILFILVVIWYTLKKDPMPIVKEFTTLQNCIAAIRPEISLNSLEKYKKALFFQVKDT